MGLMKEEETVLRRRKKDSQMEGGNIELHENSNHRVFYLKIFLMAQLRCLMCVKILHFSCTIALASKKSLVRYISRCLFYR